MGQVIQVNGDYTIKARRPGGANITLDTGPQVGSVTVTGNLNVLGTTQTYNAQVISDVVLVLNRGETGAGVTLGKSGIEIDRGSLDSADFLYDESIDAWTITHKNPSSGVYSYVDSKLMVQKILAPSIDNGDLTLIGTGTGVVKVAGTTDYEKRVIDETRLESVEITHISRSSSGNTVTITTASNHGLGMNDSIDVHCATFPLFNASNLVIVDVPSFTTLKYASTGADFPNTPVSGYIIKNSLVWPVNGSNIATDDYIPNMRAVSDYSRSLVDAAVKHFSTSHIEDQNSNVTVYDSETAGGHSNITFTVDGIERARVDYTGYVGIGTTTPAYPLDVIATEIRIQDGTSLVKEYIGPQSNNGYLFGSLTEIGLKSDTTSAAVIISKDTGSQYLTLNAGTGSSVIDLWTNDTKRASIDATGKMFINESTGSSQLNISASNAYGGTGYAGLITLKNTVVGALVPSKHIKISNTGDFEIANNANTLSILKIADDGVVTFENGLNVKNYIRTPSTSFDLINANATTVNFAGDGTTINVGSAAVSTTTNLKNAEVKIGNGTTSSITTPATTFNLINDTATTVNFAGAGTLVNVGNTTGVGLTNLFHDFVRIGTGTASRLSTPSTSFSLVDSVTDLSCALSATTINIGAITGQANLRNPTMEVGYGATTTIKSPSETVNLLNTDNTIVNFAGDGENINIGSAAVSTTTNLKNAEVKVGNGTTSAITTPATTFDLINTTAKTVNFAGAATAISMGSALPGTTTINHDVVISGSLTVNGPSSSIGSSSLTVEDPIIYLGDNNPSDAFDLGFVGGYNFGPPGNQNPTHPHTGLVRDASDNGTWKLFSGIVSEPTTTVNFADSSVKYDNLKIGDLAAVKGTFTGDLEAVKGTFSGDLKVGSNLTIAASSGNITTTGDLSAGKGTFSGDITTTGNISGGTITGTNFTGISIGMVTGGCSLADATALANAAATGAVAVIAPGGSVPVPNLTGPITSVGTATSVASQTGTGTKFVMDTSPTLITPVLGVATATTINKVTITQPTTAATLTLADNSTLATEGGFELKLKTLANTTVTFPEVTNGEFNVGYIDMPQVIQNSQGGPGLTDIGKHWFHTDAAPVTYYIDGNEPFPIGSVLTFVNDSGAGDISITATAIGLVLAGTGFVASGSVKLAADGIATAIKTTASKWLINGVGLTVV